MVLGLWHGLLVEVSYRVVLRRQYSLLHATIHPSALKIASGG